MSIQIVLCDKDGEVIEDLLLPGVLTAFGVSPAKVLATALRDIGVNCDTVKVRAPSSSVWGTATLDKTVWGIEDSCI